MESEAAVAASAGRPRASLLIGGAALAALVLVWWTMSGKSATPAVSPSKPRVAATAAAAPVVGGDLNVRLDALKQPSPSADAGSRNPFRFYTPPPPPPPPVAVAKPMPAVPQMEGPPVPVGPPPPPPITLKYIGLMEGVPGQGKVAAFSDCRSTLRGREGEVLGGQYRLVKIGVESVILEYVDGRGRTTIRMSGQECVGK